MSAQADALDLLREAPAWPRLPLGDVVDVLDKKRQPITKRNRVAGPYPYYGATGVLDWVEGYLFDEPLVLIGEDGAKWGAGADSAFAITGKTWVNNHAHVLRPNRERLIDDWLIYYLNATDLSGFISGMTVPKLNQGRLREIPIPVPPLDEQKRIVAVLDQAFAALDRARELTESNLADAQSLKNRVRETELDSRGKNWTETTISDICDRFEYGTSSKSSAEGMIPVLRMGNLQGGEIDWNDLKYSNDASDIEKYSLSAGDVLFNRTNSIEHVGKTAIYRGEREAIFAGYLIRLHYKRDQVTPDYLNIFLNSDRAKAHGHSLMGKSVNQANISASKLKSYPIALPSLAEQQAIAKKTTSIGKLSEKFQNESKTKLANIDELRQSILNKAFAGELI